jgi:outer membrane protein TolC
LLDLAEARSEALALARAGIDRAEGEALRARSGLFPQLSASASYDRALASEFEGVFDDFGGGGGNCAAFAPDASATAAERLAELERAVDCGAGGQNVLAPPAPGGGGGEAFEDLPFGQANTWRVNLSFSQHVWDGGRIGAQQRAAEVGGRSAGLDLTMARAGLLFDVTQAYYNVALTARLVQIAEASIGQSEATFQQTQASFRAGVQPEFEVLRAQVALDSQRPTLIRRRADHELALLRLRQMLDLPAGYPIEIGDPLADDALPPPPVFAARVAVVEAQVQTVDPVRAAVTAPETPARSAVAAGSLSVQVREAALALAEAQGMPNVSVNSSYARVAYRGAPSWSDFRTSWTVGASVSIPILTGGRQGADERVARAELEQARLQLRQLEEVAALDTRAAWTELVAARATWEATSGTVEQASRAYAIAEVRYGAGVSTQLELSDSRLQLQQAEASRAQAARDFQVARARVALLPDLPLGTGGTAGAPAPVPQGAPAAPVPRAPAGGAGQFVSAAAPAGAVGGIQ